VIRSAKLSAFVAALAALALCSVPAARAQDLKLPSTLTFTAYDTGSSGFNIAVAVGKMFKDKYNTDVRVLPAGNDVARLAPLKANRAQVSAMGVGVYFAQEAVFEFATKEWGPQPLQLLLAANACNALGLVAANDVGIKEMKDLKGKRIAFVVGSPALNQNALAMIAFGDLTQKDVKIVEFASNAAMFKGMINNEADAAFSSTINGQTREVESSPRGITWVRTPHGDKAGWDRIRKVGPFFLPHTATCGSGGISASNPAQMPTYPYPIFMSYASASADLVYGITKAMIVGYDDYKDGAPGAAGLALKDQKLQWAVPYHAGAVKALKEAGVWTDADEAHNNGLLKRQGVLAAGWDAFMKGNPPGDAEAFRKAWMAARKEALTKAGMDVVYEE
jgi:TRAP transporter TAXI family solute receptor